jgi:ABC-type dipeptide/oligopeptide/nickel transport system permease subunit
MMNQRVAPLFSWWPEFRKSRIGIAGMIIVGVMVVLVLLAPLIATHGVNEKDISLGWTGGSQFWTSSWINEGNVSITSEGEPFDDKPDDVYPGYHVIFQSGGGSIQRSLDLSNPLETDPHLQFQAKAVSFAPGDQVEFMVSHDGDYWETLETLEDGDDDGAYHLYDIDLSTYPNWRSRDFFIKFEADMPSPDAAFYLDTVKVALSAPGYDIVSPSDGFEPYAQKYQPPSGKHLLGTNSQSQDVWSRLLYSGQNSLMIGFVAAFLITTIGTTLGMSAGYFGGVLEELVMRLADILLILPRLPLLIVLSAYLRPGPWTVIMLLTVTGWAGIARSTRAQTLSVKQHSYVEASRSVGASNIRIIIQHILPNVAGIVIAAFVMEVVVAILVESGLSFLGLGSLSQPTWGVMLHFAQTDAAFTWGAWWWIIPPGACIALIGLGFAYIGNTLNDRFVLRLRKVKPPKEEKGAGQEAGLETTVKTKN